MYICIYVYVCAIATCVNVRGCYRSLPRGSWGRSSGHQARWQCFYPWAILPSSLSSFTNSFMTTPPPPCVCAYAHSYATVLVWKSEDNLQHPVLSSHHLSPGTHAVGLGSKCLYLLHSLQPAPALWMVHTVATLDSFSVFCVCSIAAELFTSALLTCPSLTYLFA